MLLIRKTFAPALVLTSPCGLLGVSDVRALGARGPFPFLSTLSR
jgi:hypothetical protein